MTMIVTRYLILEIFHLSLECRFCFAQFVDGTIQGSALDPALLKFSSDCLHTSLERLVLFLRGRGLGLCLFRVILINGKNV